MDITQLFPKPHPQTAGRVIDNEAVLMMADSSEIKVLNPVGSRIFELANGVMSVSEIINTLSKEYEVAEETLTIDVIEFLQNLVQQNILILVPKEE